MCVRWESGGSRFLVAGGHGGRDAAACRKRADHGDPPRLAGRDQVIEDLISDRLVEDAAVAEVDQLILQRLQLDAPIGRHIGDPDRAEVGQARLQLAEWISKKPVRLSAESQGGPPVGGPLFVD